MRGFLISQPAGLVSKEQVDRFVQNLDHVQKVYLPKWWCWLANLCLLCSDSVRQQITGTWLSLRRKSTGMLPRAGVVSPPVFRSVLVVEQLLVRMWGLPAGGCWRWDVSVDVFQGMVENWFNSLETTFDLIERIFRKVWNENILSKLMHEYVFWISLSFTESFV